MQNGMRIVSVVSLLTIPACNPWGSSSTSSTSSPAPFEPYTLKCLGPDDDSHNICVRDQFCADVYTSVEMCNFHWNGDIGAPSSPQHQHYISPDCEEGTPDAHVPCYAHPNPDTDTTPTGGNSDDTGVTTGAQDTEGSDTEGPEQYWLCNPDSNNMCFLYYDPDSETRTDAINNPSFHDKCWSAGTKFPCFYGTASTAASACEMDCSTERTNSEADCTGIGDIVISEMNGENHDTWTCDNFENTMVTPANPEQCDSFMPVWEGGPTKTFTATVMIAGSDGGSTTQVGLKGYLVLRTENCTANGTAKCDLVIEALEGSVRDLTGIYTDAAGGQMTYEVEDADFRIMQQIRGEWYLGRGTVTFPTSSAKVTAWANSITLEQASMPGMQGGLSAEQIVGSYRNDVLTLNITYNSGGELITASIETTN